MAREQTAAQRAALVAANKYRRFQAAQRRLLIAFSTEKMARALNTGDDKLLDDEEVQS